MASLSFSGLETESKRRKPFPIERRPQMLKDFLRDDFSSCSSNGFRSFPRRSCCPTVRNVREMDLKIRDSNCRKLLRSKSKAAAATISVLQRASDAVINAVKHLQFSAVKSSSPALNRSKQGILPRSLSRRLRRRFWKKGEKAECEIRVKVRVKDIVRWSSFKDLVEEKQQQPLHLSSSSLHITTTGGGAAAATTTNSNSNSWSDSDFTSDCSQSSSCSSEYSGEKEVKEDKKCSDKKIINKGGDAAGEDSTATTTKGDCQFEEKEQFSPVSVLDFPYEEEEDDEETENSSSFHQSLANMKRTKQKLMQKIRRFESLAQLEPVDLEKRIALSELEDSEEHPRDSYSIIFHDDSSFEEDEDQQEQEENKEALMAEERAMKLLKLLKAKDSVESHEDDVDGVLLDFFREKILGGNQTTRVAVREGDGLDCELLKVARDWMNGHRYGSLEWRLEDSRETCVRDIEDEGNWRKFEEEQGELAVDLEIGILGSLVDELLLDLLA